MKKKILFILVLVILSGCSVNANININYDYTVDEKINIAFSNLAAVNYDSPKEYAKSYLDYYNPTINLKKYSYEVKEGNENSNVIFSKSTDSICDSINYSLFSQYLYDDIKCLEDEYYIEIKSSGEQLISQVQSKKVFNVEELVLNVELPVEAEENNADIVSENVYTWKYDQDTSVKKDIYLKINKSNLKSNKETIEKQKETKEMTEKIFLVLSIFTIIAILLIIILSFYKKYKNNKLEY